MRTHIALYRIDRTYDVVTPLDIRPILVRVDLIQYADGVPGHAPRKCSVNEDPEVRSYVKIKDGPYLAVNQSVEEIDTLINS